MTPTPETIFWMKVLAAKKTPSDRRPVFSWDCSTRSAIIDAASAWKQTTRATSSWPSTNTVQNVPGSRPFESTPTRCSSTASGEITRPMAPTTIAPRFFPHSRVASGAAIAPASAERKTASVMPPICCAVKPQK